MPIKWTPETDQIVRTQSLVPKFYNPTDLPMLLAAAQNPRNVECEHGCKGNLSSLA